MRDCAGGHSWDEECLSAESRAFQSMPLALSTVDGQSTSSANSLLSAAGLSAFPLDTATPVGNTSSYTYIFVPYCTQDIHLGTCERTYARPLGSEMIFALLVTMINFVFKMMDFVF